MWVCWEGSEECGCAGRVVRREESGVLVIWVECRHSFCRCKCLLICKACRH